jgi:hypothetical protein
MAGTNTDAVQAPRVSLTKRSGKGLKRRKSNGCITNVMTNRVYPDYAAASLWSMRARLIQMLIRPAAGMTATRLGSYHRRVEVAAFRGVRYPHRSSQILHSIPVKSNGGLTKP